MPTIPHSTKHKPHSKYAKKHRRSLCHSKSTWYTLCCSIQFLLVIFTIISALTLLLVDSLLVILHAFSVPNYVFITVLCVSSLFLWGCATCTCAVFHVSCIIRPLSRLQVQLHDLSKLKVQDLDPRKRWGNGILGALLRGLVPNLSVSNVHRCQRGMQKLNRAMINAFSFLPHELRLQPKLDLSVTQKSHPVLKKSRSETPSVQSNRILPSSSRRSLISVESTGSFSVKSSIVRSMQDRERKFSPGLSLRDLSFVRIRFHNIYEISVQELVNQYTNCLDVITECIQKFEEGDGSTSVVESFTEECITLTFRQRVHQLAAVQTALEIDYRLRSIDNWLDVSIAVSCGTVVTGTLGNHKSRVIRSFGTACSISDHLTILAKHLEVSLVATEPVVLKAISAIPGESGTLTEHIIQRYADLILIFPDHPGSKTPTLHRVIQLLDSQMINSQSDVRSSQEPGFKEADVLFRLTNECWAHLLQSEFEEIVQLVAQNDLLISDDTILRRIKVTAEYCQRESQQWEEFVTQRESKLTRNKPCGLGFSSMLLDF